VTGSAQSPVYSFLDRPSMVDYDGHLAAVFFVSGCNFRCGFCHNAALLGAPRIGLDWERLAAACTRFRDGWVDAAVITGGEPTLHDGLAPLVAFFRRLGWTVKLDTNGSRPDVLERCLPELGCVAMDIKAGLDAYPAVTGFADTASIARSVDLLRTRAPDVEFRTTVIETIHDDAQMRAIGELIAGARRYALQPFVPRADLPDSRLRAAPRTSPDRLEALRALMQPYCREVVVRGAA
jgi:pyruvate formate lyase activating enzyme